MNVCTQSAALSSTYFATSSTVLSRSTESDVVTHKTNAAAAMKTMHMSICTIQQGIKTLFIQILSVMILCTAGRIEVEVLVGAEVEQSGGWAGKYVRVGGGGGGLWQTDQVQP